MFESPFTFLTPNIPANLIFDIFWDDSVVSWRWGWGWGHKDWDDTNQIMSWLSPRHHLLLPSLILTTAWHLPHAEPVSWHGKDDNSDHIVDTCWDTVSSVDSDVDTWHCCDNVSVVVNIVAASLQLTWPSPVELTITRPSNCFIVQN